MILILLLLIYKSYVKWYIGIPLIKAFSTLFIRLIYKLSDQKKSQINDWAFKMVISITPAVAHYHIGFIYLFSTHYLYGFEIFTQFPKWNM